MTISARGLTKYMNDEIEFQSLEEWEKEKNAFNQLKSIEFFKIFKLFKSYNLWKRLARRNIMKECTKVISNKLYCLDRTLRKPLLEIRNYCWEM